MALVQLEELASGVCHAADLGDALGKACLVAEKSSVTSLPCQQSRKVPTRLSVKS